MTLVLRFIFLGSCSYYYAADTGLYYLQSRYYDPAIGRFINADTFISTGTGLLGNNMFAYCNNNPANSSDPTGMCPMCMADEDSDQVKTNTNDECSGGGSGGGGGTRGGRHSNSGQGATSNNFGLDRPVSPVRVKDSALKNVDVHSFKQEFVGNQGSKWDIYKDTSNNSSVWLADKAQSVWIQTGYLLAELLVNFLKGWK